jgi:hypothetical protein
MTTQMKVQSMSQLARSPSPRKPSAPTTSGGPSLLQRLRLKEAKKLLRAGLINNQTAFIFAAHHLRPEGELTKSQRYCLTRNIMAWAAETGLPVTELEIEVRTQEVICDPRRWSADAAAWFFQLRWADRQRLGITTIGAIDKNKEWRNKRRREQNRLRNKLRRRDKGAKPRSAYESESLTKQQPWKRMGISKSTWYRRRKASETSADAPMLNIHCAHPLVSTPPAPRVSAFARFARYGYVDDALRSVAPVITQDPTRKVTNIPARRR